MMDQIMGNSVPPILTIHKAGKPSNLASHTPSKAPIKPTAMDTRQPPPEKPTIACPIQDYYLECSSHHKYLS